MHPSSQPFGDDIVDLGVHAERTITVRLSNEIVTLLSSQLYQSPLKAIEELVVNSYDAEASQCKLFVPESSDDPPPTVLVYDDGVGMNAEGLADLWLVGRSHKRDSEVELRAKRKQIGKFGIGKLATYAIANVVTYVSRCGGAILGVSCNFRAFKENPEGIAPVVLPVIRIDTWERLLASEILGRACERAGVDLGALLEPGPDVSWTLVLLEDLKQPIQLGRLRWVLSSAMPLQADFGLTLNGALVVSSKESIPTVAKFDVAEIAPKRLQAVNKETHEDWHVDSGRLVSTCFPAGLSGTVSVAEKSLHVGKSRDLGRSHGFFVRVRGRLINEEDPLFGLAPLSFQTFNRFRAELDVDDLDDILTAQREGVGESAQKHKVLQLLEELFYEGRDRYEEWKRTQDEEAKRKKEHERTYVPMRLVEHPLADVLSSPTVGDEGGAEADGSWFYLDIREDENLGTLVAALNSRERTKKYRYRYTRTGRTSRLVQFSPREATFYLNRDHDLVIEYSDEQRCQELLESIATAEALLEIYLREHGMRAHVVGQILERRDSLLRGLANESRTSVAALGSFLRESADDQHDLEVALVSASRGLGFVAKHISGSGEPDGIGRFRDYPDGEKKITLEAKSSTGTPALGHLDFAGLREHMSRCEADGCLLVASSYPGVGKGEAAAVANRAKENRVSCWSVEQLARVVTAAESRQIGAKQVLDVVLKSFSPGDVTRAVEKLLEEPIWEHQALYREIVRSLQRLEGRLEDMARSVEHVAVDVSARPEFAKVKQADVESAVRDLAAVSQGALTIRRGRIMTNVSLEELERRVAALTGNGGMPRGRGTFRDRIVE